MTERMEKKLKEELKKRLTAYQGILFNYPEFEKGNGEIVYDLHCPQYDELIRKYKVDQIASGRGEFEKATALLRYFSPRLSHNSWAGQSLPCDSISLLDYALDNDEHGIGCFHKSKILEECCLACGIFARRAFIHPFSPYDFDNHVVMEMYDTQMNKWIMLDPTSGGYFTDDKNNPLSVLEIRDMLASEKEIRFVSTQAADEETMLEETVYIAKNMFYFSYDQYSGYGEKEGKIWLVPSGYDLKKNQIANLRFILNHLPEDQMKRKGEFLDEIDRIQANTDSIVYADLSSIT